MGAVSSALGPGLEPYYSAVAPLLLHILSQPVQDDLYMLELQGVCSGHYRVPIVLYSANKDTAVLARKVYGHIAQ